MFKGSKRRVLGLSLLALAATGCTDDRTVPPQVSVFSVHNPDANGGPTLWLGGPATATTPYRAAVYNDDQYASYDDVHLEIYVEQGGTGELEDRLEPVCPGFVGLPANTMCDLGGELRVREDGVRFVPGEASLRAVLVQGTSHVLDEGSCPVLLAPY